MILSHQTAADSSAVQVRRMKCQNGKVKKKAVSAVGRAVAKDLGGQTACLMKSRSDFPQQRYARLFAAQSKCHLASGENKFP